MQLTRHTDYAFRALIYLASMPEQTVTIGTISDVFNIPKSHMMKVISRLTSNGYICSIRGKMGGISLAKPAQDITLKEIVVLMEKTLVPFDCVGQNCLILKSCRLNTASRLYNCGYARRGNSPTYSWLGQFYFKLVNEWVVYVNSHFCI